MTRVPAGQGLYPNSELIDKGLQPETVYSYTVEPVDSAGDSAGAAGPVTGSTLSLMTPANLSATPLSGTQVELQWGRQTFDNATVFYDVLRAIKPADANATPDFVSILPGGPGTLPVGPGGWTVYLDETCVPETNYLFKVVGYDATPPEPSAASAIAIAEADTTDEVPPPTSPTNLRAGYGGLGRVGLAWDAGTGGGLLGFDVYRGTTADFALDAAALIGSSTDHGYTDDLPNPGGVYWYVVKAASEASDGGGVVRGVEPGKCRHRHEPGRPAGRTVELDDGQRGRRRRP